MARRTPFVLRLQKEAMAFVSMVDSFVFMEWKQMLVICLTAVTATHSRESELLLLGA